MGFPEISTYTSSRRMASLFLLLVVLGTFVAVGADDETPPITIEPSSAITVPAGGTLTLTCRGIKPVAWIHLSRLQNDSRLEIKNETSAAAPKHPYQFSSILMLKSVTGHDAQHYTCEMDDDELEEGSEVRAYRIVYVEDEEKLLVTNDVQGLEFYTMTKGTRYTVPSCRPSHLGVKVTLSHGSRPIDPNTDPGWSYTDADGYTIDPVVTASEDYYVCTGEKGSKKQTQNIYLRVVDASVTQNVRLTINGTNFRSASVGETFILDCNIESGKGVFYGLNWTEPKSVLQSGRAKLEQVPVPSNDNKKRYRHRLTVFNATKADGDDLYICVATISSGQKSQKRSVNQTVHIFAPGEEFLDVDTSTSREKNITVNASREAKWVIYLHGYPAPDPDHYSWKSPKGSELVGSIGYKYKLRRAADHVTLSIQGVTMQDGGRYKFIAENGYHEKSIDLTLTVRDGPEVYILKKRNLTFFNFNKNYTFECKANGYPYPTAEWFFKNCLNDTLNEDECEDFMPITTKRKARHMTDEEGPRYTLLGTTFQIKGTGYLRCEANNSIGVGEDTVLVVAVDFPDPLAQGYSIHGAGDEETPNPEPVETDDVEYICSVSKVNFTSKIEWLYKPDINAVPVPANTLQNVSIHDKTTDWSHQATLKINNITTNYSGIYICEVEPIYGDETLLTTNITVNVLRMAEPIITASNLNSSSIQYHLGNSAWKDAIFYCNAKGVPTPEITWLKDDEPVTDIPGLREKIILGDGTLRFDFVSEDFSGVYKCRASNRVSYDEKRIEIAFVTHASLSNFWIIVIVVLSIGCIIFALWTAWYKLKERRMKQWLKKLSLDDFEKGDVEKINPEQGIVEQVNLLPYDKKFEFPRDKLKLGIQIGSGAFGRVLRAQAFGIRENERMTTVAVKMVKPNGDDSHFKALMSELKIMIHLGQHVNVVNLLGACTKQLLKKRELLVIVEYCKYGSLLSYLHRHQNDFIDQLDRNLDIVDPNSCYPLEQQCISPGQRLNYAALTFTDSGTSDGRPIMANGYHTMRELEMDHLSPRTSMSNHHDDYALSTHVQSVCTDMSYVSSSPTVLGTDGNRRSSSASTWNGHYRGVYQERDVRPITTTDLLCWNFQIARGMEYLAQRNVLHGDLAARNVLLGENNVVKICDFGLAKEMYHQENYKKKTEVPLPIKWMAIESIYYRVFSTQSDVWSFGVVMWELFTLGKNPYPGMEPDEQFYTCLNQGYRMEKPRYAPSSIYDLMCSCWDKEPSMRPTFTALADRIGDLMEEGLRKHYIDLNVPYTSLNQEQMRDRTDYLGQMSGPDFACVSRRPTPDRSYANILEVDPNCGPSQSPNMLPIPSQHFGTSGEYQNLETLPSTSDPHLQRLANNAGYVFMKSRDSVGPTEIFSPRPDKPSEENIDPNAELQFSYDNNPNVRKPMTHSPGRETESSGHSTTPSPVPYNEVQGISNMNYVPNTFFQMKNKNIQDVLPPGGPSISDHEDLQKHKTRHKNDSGVSSIDSNFEANLKRTTPPPNLFNGHHDNELDTENSNIRLLSLHSVPITANSQA